MAELGHQEGEEEGGVTLERDLLDWVLGITAAWGALAGTLALLWQVLRDRPGIRVTAEVYTATSGGQVIHEKALYITAYNAGKTPVLLRSAGVLAPRREHRRTVVVARHDADYTDDTDSAELPLTLRPGQEAHVWTAYARPFRPPYDTSYYRDGSGQYYLARVSLCRRVRRWVWLCYGRLPR